MATNLNSNLANIVLVEDNLSDIEYLIFLLKKHNIKCNLQIFRDGQEILDLLYKKGNYAKLEHPDVIVLDLNIPKINGLEILKMIHKDKALNHLPVLILSGSHFEKDVVECFKHGALFFMHKPFDINIFLKSIHETGNLMVQISENCTQIVRAKR